MLGSRTFDPSPLSSLICAGHYRQADKRVAARPSGLADWGLTYTLRGAGRFRFPQQSATPLLTRPGLLVLVRPGLGHIYDAPGKLCDHLWLHFRPRPHWMEWLEWPEQPPGIRALFIPAGPARREIVGAFRRIVRLTAAPDPDRELFAMNALEQLLLWCLRAKPKLDSPARDPRIHTCVDYISENLHRVITLADLAKLSGQSVSRLTHRFREQTGLSPMQFLEQRRLQRAMELLTRTRMTVHDVAAAVGFENPFYFTLRFHKHAGYSPRAFRHKTSRPTTILRRPGLDLNPDDRKLLQRASDQ